MAKEPNALDEDDPGLSARGQQERFQAQDEAFQSALRRAVADGKERAVEGVKVDRWVGH